MLIPPPNCCVVVLCCAQWCGVACCVCACQCCGVFRAAHCSVHAGRADCRIDARQSRDCLRVVRLPSRLSRESSVRFSREKTPRMALSTMLTAPISGSLRSLPLPVALLPAIASVIRCVWLRRLVARHSPRRPWLLASLASRGANRRTARRRVAKFAHRPSPSWFARAALSRRLLFPPRFLNRLHATTVIAFGAEQKTTRRRPHLTRAACPRPH